MVDATRRMVERHRRLGRIALQIVAGPDRGRRVVHDLQQLDATQTLRGGRSEVNDIVLRDEHTSNVHFELVVTPDTVLLRDLDSTNGVRIHGIRVKEAWLTPHAVFQAGQSHISLEAADPVDVQLPDVDHFEGLFGRSVAMRELFARLEKIASRSETPQGDKLRVLITGETGTGKELVARGLHRRSRRSDGPLIIRDCTTIPRELADSILFGHSKGAFTGADAHRPGCFEEAHGGTLFLDEIGELPLDSQAKLLRVLQEETVTRVGEHVSRRVDVRVLCATHRDLQRMVGEGTFRQDLYFRLAGLQVRMPSLREREDDVVFLARLFLHRFLEEGQPLRTLSPAAVDLLCAHSWPGNVRELRAALERASIMAEGDMIGPADLGLEGSAPASDGALTAFFGLPLAEAVDGFKRRYFEVLLTKHPTRVKAAQAAGITYEWLRQELRRLAPQKG